MPAGGWKPRHYQVDEWNYLQTTPWKARLVLCHHRRAGKDHLAINWAARATALRPGGYAHVFPYATQGRKVVWDGLDKAGRKFLDAFPEDYRAGHSDRDMKLFLKSGSFYQVIGADDPNRLVGPNFVGFILSEYALMDPNVMPLILPIVRENDGWIIITSTPRGRNHYWRLFENALSSPNWYVSVKTIDDTGVIDKAEVEEEIHMGLISREMAMQEYWCSFGVVSEGAYYAKQINDAKAQGRVTDLKPDRSLPLLTCWDLGIDDQTAIWFYQRKGAERLWLRSFESSDEPLGFYAEKCRQVSIDLKAPLGRCFFPHDVSRREYTSGKSVLSAARAEGLDAVQVPGNDVRDGIETVRTALRTSWFDQSGCYSGIQALEGYRRDYDTKARTYRNKPKHDWASHFADAFRYGVMGDSSSGKEERNRHEELSVDRRAGMVQTDYRELDY